MENELRKCLMCKNPQCAKCPAGTDVRRIIELVRAGKVHEAGALLFDNNPLSAITGLVCPNHLFCKGGCVKGLDFGVIEREISKRYLEHVIARNEAIQIPRSLGTGSPAKNVLVVGSGPAGLSISYYLRKAGYNVELWEKEHKFGGMLRYGIPNFRLDKNLIDLIVGRIEKMGVMFNKGIKVDLQNLPSGFDIIVLAIGAGVSRRLDIEGSELAVYALDYLKTASAPTPSLTCHPFVPKGNTVVIGAGNVAIDCALTAASFGSVNLCYRKDEAAMKAYPEELAHARNKGVVFNYHMVPKKITNEGVLFENGRFMPADKVIIAIGQGATKDGLIKPTELGNNVYAIGDAVTGTSTIVQVVAQAKELARILTK